MGGKEEGREKKGFRTVEKYTTPENKSTTHTHRWQREMTTLLNSTFYLAHLKKLISFVCNLSVEDSRPFDL